MNKEEKFAHDMANILMSIEGKVKKLKLVVDTNTLVELEKIESKCNEAKSNLSSYKRYLNLKGS